MKRTPRLAFAEWENLLFVIPRLFEFMLNLDKTFFFSSMHKLHQMCSLIDDHCFNLMKYLLSVNSTTSRPFLGYVADSPQGGDIFTTRNYLNITL